MRYDLKIFNYVNNQKTRLFRDKSFYAKLTSLSVFLATEKLTEMHLHNLLFIRLTYPMLCVLRFAVQQPRKIVYFPSQKNHSLTWIYNASTRR